MACASITGYKLSCSKDSFGGLRKIHIAAKADVYRILETGGVITTLEMYPGKLFQTFELVRNTSSFSTVLTGSAVNGSAFFTETVTLVMNRLRASTSAILQALIKNSLVVIVEDKNGELILLGRENGLDAQSATVGSGTASGDRNGYDVVLTGEEAKVSHIDPAILPTLLVPSILVYSPTIVTVEGDTWGEGNAT